MRMVIRIFAGVIMAGGLLAAAPAIPELVTSSPLQDPQKPPQQREIVITANNPGSHPNVGVPDFAIAGDAKARETADLVANVLWADLDYEREFYMINRKSSASIPPAATPQTLPFDQWKQI